MEFFSATDDLMAYAIGTAVLEELKNEEVLQKVVAAAETRAMQTLEDIYSALDDDRLDDPECFHRIEAIIHALQDVGIYTLRHDP